MPIAPDRLIEWLIEECKQRNWTWNEASVNAGLSRNSISSYINGVQPGLLACKALAKLFRKPPEYVLQLAGHLPAPADSDPNAVEVEYRLRRLNHSVREQYLPIIDAVLEAAEAAGGEAKEEEE